MTNYVAYCRVSTAQQGRSGLGLEAQEAAIRGFLKPGDKILAPTYVEVESGKRSDRPELAKALQHANLTGATLLVAKVDRLSRNTFFLQTILNSGVEVAFCDIPQASGATGRFILQTMASVAELEAGLISERTKAALRAAKERGTKLGGFRGVKVDPTLGTAAKVANADAFSMQLSGVLEALKAEGFTSLRDIAGELNARGIRTPRGGGWSAVQVKRVVERV